MKWNDFSRQEIEELNGATLMENIASTTREALKRKWENLSDAAKEVISLEEYILNVYRAYDAIGEFSNVDKNDLDVLCIAKNISMWAGNKSYIIKSMKECSLYDINNPYKIVRHIDIERKVDKSVIRKYAMSFVEDNLTTFLAKIIFSNTKAYIEQEDVELYELAKEKYSTPDHDALLFIKPLSEEEVNKLNNINPHVGQKTSKFVRKLIMELKGTINEHDFAEYADAINPIVFKRPMILSCDPIDYLLMSHGTGWNSCHWINSEDPGTYEGCNAGGVWSYMNDEVSMIMYTVNERYTEDYELQEKINREVVMWESKGKSLVTCRIYPQSCDCGCNELYTEFRGYAQKFASDTFGVSNYWKVKKYGSDYHIPFIEHGEHNCQYHDDYYFSSAWSVPCSETETEESLSDELASRYPTMYVGEAAYCPCCGSDIWEEGDPKFICDNCRGGNKVYCNECGCVIDLDEEA